MTGHDDLRLALGSYLAGALDDAARVELDVHLRDCATCSHELAELAPLPGLLAGLRADEADPGAAALPESLLPDLLARAREVEASGRLRLRRRRMLAGALGAAAAAAVVALVALFAPSSPGGPSYELHAPTAPAASAVLAGRVRLGGRVTLVAKPWGTELLLTLTGLPSGTSCVAVVTGARGHDEVTGSWGPTPDHSALVQLATRMRVTQLTGVTVETLARRRLLTARVGLRPVHES